MASGLRSGFYRSSGPFKGGFGHIYIYIDREIDYDLVFRF